MFCCFCTIRTHCCCSRRREVVKEGGEWWCTYNICFQYRRGSSSGGRGGGRARNRNTLTYISHTCFTRTYAKKATQSHDECKEKSLMFDGSPCSHASHKYWSESPRPICTFDFHVQGSSPNQHFPTSLALALFFFSSGFFSSIAKLHPSSRGGIFPPSSSAAIAVCVTSFQYNL